MNDSLTGGTSKHYISGRMKYSASIEDREQMTARDEKLMAPHKSSGEDSARVDQASAAQADSSRPHLLTLG